MSIRHLTENSTSYSTFEMFLMTKEIILDSAKIGQIRQLVKLLNFPPFIRGPCNSQSTIT